MNIYFSCSITGGRDDEQVYQALVNTLIEQGHYIPTAHLSQANILELENVTTPREVYERDIKWINDCDSLIAEVSTPSHGVGYEIALALFQNKPVLCCYHSGRKVSKIFLGNTNPSLQVCAYNTIEHMLECIHDFLAELQATRKKP